MVIKQFRSLSGTKWRDFDTNDKVLVGELRAGMYKIRDKPKPRKRAKKTK